MKSWKRVSKSKLSNMFLYLINSGIKLKKQSQKMLTLFCQPEFFFATSYSRYKLTCIGRGQVVLLVSNLPDSVANVNSIFNLLGVYGDVLCVKILHNKRDCALVQMAKPHQAQQVPNESEKTQIFLLH